MTQLSFDIEKTRNRLNLLPRRYVLTFGVWQLERMIPNFVRFCVESHFPGTWLLKGAAVFAWSVIETQEADRFHDLQVKQYRDIEPDTEGYSSIYTSSALDAVVAAENIINYIRTNQVELIVEISSLARDSADVIIQHLYGHELEGEDFERNIQIHPIMQNELREQESDISFLENLLTSNKEFMPSVLERAMAK